MKSRHLQNLLAFIFLGLGGWCLLFPLTVESLVFKPEYLVANQTSAMLMGCFGAQAVLGGVLMLFAEFKPRTFWVFGLVGSLPFFAFNYYFYFVVELFTEWMLLDFVGNLGILTCGLWGYRLKKNEQESLSQGMV